MKQFYLLLGVLFSFCIFTIMSNTTSYAYTFDDFIYFCETIQSDATQFDKSIQRILDSEQALKSSIGSNVYKTYVVFGNNNGGYTELLCTNQDIEIRYNNGQTIGIKNYTSFDVYHIQYTNGVITTSTQRKNSFAISNYYGILETTNNWTDWGNGFFNNKWVEPIYFYFEPFNNNVTTINGIENIHLENFSRTIQQWQLGTLIGYTENTIGIIEMYQGENRQWIQVANLQWDSIGEVFVYNSNLLYYQLYRIYFYNEDFDYTDTYGFYFLPIDVTYSGESLIYNGNDNNNLQPLIEQNNDNQNFWKNTYDSLFSMSSGDVNEVYLMVESYFPSGDTPLSVYDTIFGAYGNEPDDFIIRWDDHPLNITWFGGQQLYSGDFIKAGYMNFSKECRDNEVLGNIKFWFNTLFTVFILIGYYKFMYNCFCDMLGVVSQDIPEEEPKHRPIGFGRGDDS